jgi:hypothetical protein
MLTLISALPVAATVVVAVIFVLLLLLGSVVVAVAEAASVMIVPAAVPAFTCTVSVKVAVPVLASAVVFVQVTVPVAPTAGVAHVQPVTAGKAWKVVFAGIASVKVTVVALAGPLLVSTWVYVIGSPARTDVTEGVFVIERSASPVIETFVIVVALLLAGIGSVVVDEVAEAVLLIGVVVPAVILSGKLAVAKAARLAIVQVTVPVPPTAGFVQVQPVGFIIDENVVPVGMVSVNVTFKAVLGPLLVKVCAYVSTAPGVTGEGVADAVIDRSASATTVSDVVAELLTVLGSVRVVEVRVTVPLILIGVPFAVPAASATTTAKEPVDAPIARLLPVLRVHVIAPG